MKSKKIKGIVGAIFALSLTLGVGLALTRNDVSNPTEIVLAEGEEGSGDSATPGDSEQPTEQTPAATEETPKEETSTTSTTAKTEDSSISAKEVGKAIAKTFRDAWYDLLAHIKRWFHLK